jgi:uncharacterized protein
MPDRTPFHIMTKPIGPRCNIDCRYCYYLEKDMLYPSEKKFRMSDTMLEHYILSHIATSLEAGQTEVLFAWQGGEPTMLGLDYFRHILDLQAKYRPDGVRIANTIQTNGTLLDGEWAAFLAAENFLVGISVDGPKKQHDHYRRDRSDRPTFDAVMRGLDHLRRANVEFNILTTVHRANVSRGKELYRFLRELGSPFLQFIPIVERKAAGRALAAPPRTEADSHSSVTDWSVAPRAYGKFLCDIFDIWYRQDVGRIFVQFIEAQIRLWSGYPSSLCIFSETCGNALVLEHNGDLYACDHFVYPDYRIGNITHTPLRDLVWSEKAHAFGQDKAEKLQAECHRCRFRFACNGGCPKHRFVTSRNGETGQNYFCESYKMFFNHAGPRIKAPSAGQLV